MKFSKYKITLRPVLLALFVAPALMLPACRRDFLKEKPLDFLNSDVVLTNKEGFESAVVGLHEAVRYMYFREDGSKMWSMYLGTDIAEDGDRTLSDFRNYQTWVTPTLWADEWYWDQLYTGVIPRANAIITYAAKPGVKWDSEQEKNAIVAEAKFFRAWAYNFLANLYGGVPIVDTFLNKPKTDFVRSTREQVYQFERQDLEFASQWLPAVADVDGRITKAAADELLTEVYIDLGQYDKAVASATSIINDGIHHLMTSRFGKHTDEPGDVFSDLFAPGNQNRSDGNMETIWALQFEPRSVPGGTVDNGHYNANTWQRAWGPKWWELKDPDGNPGMQLVVDSLGRGVAWVRPTSYFLYDIWKNDAGDIRNSRFNIRRDYYYNNPASAYFGQKVDPAAINADTLVDYYPTITKIEGDGELTEGATYGRSFTDVYMMRLAETYLLRAEAYFRAGAPQKAADDINVLRARAHAQPIDASDVNLDFILDERARELVIEESRRLTLSRMGKLVDRTRQYNPQSGSSIQDYNALFPIPQTAIDANINAKLEQNPGY
jgi:hypothetical protein